MICRRSPDVLYASPSSPAKSLERPPDACLQAWEATAARHRPEPANCRAPAQVVGSSAGLHMFAGVSVRRYYPQLPPCSPTHPYSEILGNPASRAQTSTLTLATLSYLASLLCSSSLLPLQDDRE